MSLQTPMIIHDFTENSRFQLRPCSNDASHFKGIFINDNIIIIVYYLLIIEEDITINKLLY